MLRSLNNPMAHVADLYANGGVQEKYKEAVDVFLKISNADVVSSDDAEIDRTTSVHRASDNVITLQ